MLLLLLLLLLRRRLLNVTVRRHSNRSAGRRRRRSGVMDVAGNAVLLRRHLANVSRRLLRQLTGRCRGRLLLLLLLLRLLLFSGLLHLNCRWVGGSRSGRNGRREPMLIHHLYGVHDWSS